MRSNSMDAAREASISSFRSRASSGSPWQQWQMSSSGMTWMGSGGALAVVRGDQAGDALGGGLEAAQPVGAVGVRSVEVGAAEGAAVAVGLEVVVAERHDPDLDGDELAVRAAGDRAEERGVGGGAVERTLAHGRSSER